MKAQVSFVLIVLSCLSSNAYIQRPFVGLSNDNYNTPKYKTDDIEDPVDSLLSLSTKFNLEMPESVKSLQKRPQDPILGGLPVFGFSMQYAGAITEIPRPDKSILAPIVIEKYEPYYDLVVVVNTASRSQNKKGQYAFFYRKDLNDKFFYAGKAPVASGRETLDTAPGNETVAPHKFWSITEAGFFTAQMLDRNHKSSSYENHPMNFSVFFNMEQGQASHEGDSIGHHASAGCLRMSGEDAKWVFDAVENTYTSDRSGIPLVDKKTGEFRKDSEGRVLMQSEYQKDRLGNPTRKLPGYKTLYIINSDPTADYSKLAHDDNPVLIEDEN